MSEQGKIKLDIRTVMQHLGIDESKWDRLNHFPQDSHVQAHQWTSSKIQSVKFSSRSMMSSLR